MEFVDGPIEIGQWMPDAKDLKFPDLEDLKNAEPVGTVYKSFAPLVDDGGPVVPGGFLRGFHQAIYGGVVYTYAGTDDGLFESFGGAAFTARSATMSPTQYDFLQFDDLEIVVPSAAKPMLRTIGSASNFATIGSAPTAVRIGRINQFVFLGNLTASHAVRWSGIDDPSAWETPNSATAIAQQSGEQILDASLGEVTGFSNGDQHGLIFQASGITRVTYVGPPVVFQFDKISDKIGCSYPRSIVQVGSYTYFLAASGFHRTDGVSVENIGENRVNSYFLQKSSGAAERVYGAANPYRNLIYWAYCNTGDTDSTPSDLIIYNYKADRFSRASQFCEGILGTHGLESSLVREIRGFGSSNTLGSFSASTSNSSGATIETGDIEFNPGGFSHLSGAKLLIDQTANAQVAYSLIRTDLVSITASSASTANADTGFSDFRREARYHRLRWVVPGIFTQAQAMEFKVKKSGSR